MNAPFDCARSLLCEFNVETKRASLRMLSHRFCFHLCHINRGTFEKPL